MVFKDLNYIQNQNALLSANNGISKNLAGPATLVTKETLLSQANGFWQRMAIHFKWLLIKSYRPFNVDEITAFFSWIILSHILWIVLGTTTFFSLLFLGLNSLFAKELVGTTMGKLLTYVNPSFSIMFEDAVVPEWKEGMIDFKKVIIKTVDNESGLQLDLKVDSIKLTLSFKKWKDFKGMIENVEIQGMTGVIDKRNINLNEPEVNWFANKNYELHSLKITDSILEIIDRESKNPLKIAIYNCEIPNIRVNWLFLDCLNANHISGSFNDSLYTIHKRQHKLAYVTDIADDMNPWKRMMRYRLDSTDLDSIGITNSAQLNWLTDGKVDIMADIMPPVEDLSNNNHDGNDDDIESKYVVFDFKIQFHDLKTKIPSEVPRLSTGEALLSMDELKPIIAYVNNKRAEQTDTNSGSVDLPPLNFRIVKRLSELKSVSTLRETGLFDAIATEIYIDLMKHVQEYEMEQRNKRLVNWSKTVASQLLVVGLGAMA